MMPSTSAPVVAGGLPAADFAETFVKLDDRISRIFLLTNLVRELSERMQDANVEPTRETFPSIMEAMDIVADETRVAHDLLNDLGRLAKQDVA